MVVDLPLVAEQTVGFGKIPERDCSLPECIVLTYGFVVIGNGLAFTPAAGGKDAGHCLDTYEKKGIV